MRRNVSAEADGWIAVRATVLNRDGGCFAAKRGAEGGCATRVGGSHSWDALHLLELDHVKEQPHIGDPLVKRTKRGYKAPDDEAHLIAICAYHHETWATSHRPAERAYLRKRYPEVWRRG